MKMEISSILVVADAQRPAVKAAVDAFAREVESQYALEVTRPEEVASAEGKYDIGVVFGGDGTMLAAARALGAFKVPLMGVHLGRFGFLTHFESDSFPRQFVRMAETREFPATLWMMLKCRHKRFSSYALNDVVITGAGASRMVEIGVFVDGEHAMTCRGDGIIIATPVGSTAHSLSAGGPITDPRMEAIVVTPICPHTLTNRPLVIPSTSRIKLKPSAPAYLTVDGQVDRPLKKNEEVYVERAPFSLRVVLNPDLSYYDLLRNKLFWGRMPAHGDSQDRH